MKKKSKAVGQTVGQNSVKRVSLLLPIKYSVNTLAKKVKVEKKKLKGGKRNTILGTITPLPGQQQNLHNSKWPQIRIVLEPIAGHGWPIHTCRIA